MTLDVIQFRYPMVLGPLRIFYAYGAGNPRDFFSNRTPSLLKFQSLKLKGIEEKRRGGLGTPHGTGCVADSEHLGESTGSIGQVWSTNFETQPLTISCGFPAPCLAISFRGPPVLLTRREVSAPITEGTTDWGLGDYLSKAMLRVLQGLQINISI